MASTVRYAPAPAPITHALSRPYAGAETLLADYGSDCESVAESSCPWPLPLPHRPAASGGEEEELDDDGCSSCVEGNELCYYQEGDEEEEEEASTARVWWKQRVAAAYVAGGALQQEVGEVEDPERAAARQAEDRKFWEDCLGTGYP